MAAIGPSNFFQALGHYETGRYLDGSALALYLYDYLLTFRMEVELVWKANWTATKALFLLNRYLPLFDLVLTYYGDNGIQIAHICNTLFRANTWMYMIGLYVSEIVLTLRVWAVWKMNKFIIVASILFHGISFGVLSAKVDQMVAPLEYFDLPPLTGCLSFLEQSVLWIAYVILLTNDCAMLVLISIAFVKAYKRSELGLVTAPGMRLVEAVYQEGVLFYVCMLAVSIITFFTTFLFQDDSFMFVYVSRILRVILAGRVILHIREAYAQKGLEDLTGSGPISFRSNGLEATCNEANTIPIEGSK